MLPKNPIPDPPKSGHRLASLMRLLKSLQHRISNIEEDFDRILPELDESLLLLMTRTEQMQFRVGQLRTDAASAERRRLQKDHARHGAISVRLMPLADGPSLVQIDGRTEVPLPPRVSALLAVLIHDSGTKADQFVGWKSFDAIRSRLKESTGKSLTNHAIKELVLRLRNTLEAHEENRYLVLSKRSFGYRFALRRKDGGITGSDHR